MRCCTASTSRSGIEGIISLQVCLWGEGGDRYVDLLPISETYFAPTQVKNELVHISPAEDRLGRLRHKACGHDLIRVRICLSSLQGLETRVSGFSTTTPS